MKRTSIQLLKAAATKLRDSKLKRLGGKEISLLLDNLAQAFSLDNRDEAIIFTAIFDRSCTDRDSDLDDIASYFDCSQLDIMEYVPTLKSLMKKGLVVQTDLSECRLTRQNFMVSNYVVNCILENRKPEFREARFLEKEFDRYDFCSLVDSQIQNSDVTTEALLQFLDQTERDNASMPLVKELKGMIPQLADRALFYEVCYDFFNHDGGGYSDLSSTLSDMYQAYGLRFRERQTLVEGTHPLIKADLIELSGSDNDEIMLTMKGQQFFLGEDYGTFGKKYDGLNRYTFANKIAEYVHDRGSETELPTAKRRLASKIRQIEDSNPRLTCLQKVRAILPEEDYRALFYIVCEACAESGGVNLSRELSFIYNVKDRNVNIKEFKDETHKMQRTDLVELRTESSLFGEYTVLQLTDKGKQLYFEEDAELFIEKVDKKNLIFAADIKEKHLFFAENEHRQLSHVGSILQEDNYQSLVARLESKGLSKGIAILLYGAPGTGKTESVMQWARQSHRDIVHVDISAAKSMWYGESEKIVKDIFTRYKRQCKRSAVKPILLFNEADAIFSKRKSMDGAHSVDQTENTIQNIILEEMEKLDGILIATTNLADNLDKAFERRFLFKIRFDKPTVEAKRNIWLDKLPALQEQEASTLAAHFDFSGGEIDNIVRKATMLEVVDGTKPTIVTLQQLCNEEKINKSNTKIGFTAK